MNIFRHGHLHNHVSICFDWLAAKNEFYLQILYANDANINKDRYLLHSIMLKKIPYNKIFFSCFLHNEDFLNFTNILPVLFEWWMYDRSQTILLIGRWWWQDWDFSLLCYMLFSRKIMQNSHTYTYVKSSEEAPSCLTQTIMWPKTL